MSPSKEITKELLDITARLHALLEKFAEGIDSVSAQANALHERATGDGPDDDD